MLIPLMWFIFDSTWDAATPTVYMTPTKVWGPLAYSYGPFLVVYPKAAMGLAAAACVWYALRKWANPNIRIL